MKKKIIITVAIFTLAITATAMQLLRNVTKNDRQLRKGQDRTVSINDRRLRAYLLKKYDTDGDNRLSVVEAEAIRTIECSSMKIEQLPDLAHFPNLEILRCDNNKITRIGSGRNPHLVKIIADDNPLATIDLGGFPALRKLEVSGCDLESVDLTSCPELEYIDCSYTDLVDINLSGCPALRYIDLSECDLKSIDLSLCPELEEIYVYGNYCLTALDLTACPKLINVACDDFVIVTMPQLCFDIAIHDTRVVLTFNTLKPDTGATLPVDDLRLLACLLKEYDIDRDGRLSTTEAEAISVISCSEKGITRLPDLTLFPNLRSLYCNSNKITHIGGNNPHLVDISASYNYGVTIDLSGFPALRSLWMSFCKMNSLDLTPCHELDTLVISENRLTSLDLTHCPKLIKLRCEWTAIDTLDLRLCPRLADLHCRSNDITGLLLDDHPELTNIDCDGNDLVEINLRGCPLLERLSVDYNELQSLDLSGNPKLRDLSCGMNNLRTLDLRANHELDFGWVYYYDNDRLKKVILPQSCLPGKIREYKGIRYIYNAPAQ